MDILYNKVCHQCSEMITRNYSTSFSLGIRVFAKEFRKPIYSIYGFVRFADEIVDTFSGVDKHGLLRRFRQDTFDAIEMKVSINPVLHAFQQIVHEYQINYALIEAFLDSMEMDLTMFSHDKHSYDKYIYGSAEVVGLMCLHVFTEKDEAEYERLAPFAKALGSAFQKINFLRDVKSDFEDRGRVYFPGVDFHRFSEADKATIEDDIQADFDKGLEGIRMLPKGVRFGVYTAYKYYLFLFNKIKAFNSQTILSQRVRVRNRRKLVLLTEAIVKNSLNMI